MQPNPYGYTDRHGKPLKIGQRVRVQTCTGRYGQTEIREGVIEQFSEYCGMTLKTASGALIYTTITRAGYEKFDDFEHAHEKWTEIEKTGQTEAAP
jgi:hypothetical protein